MGIRSCLALAAGCGILAAVTSAGAATTFPVSIGFDTAAQFDNNFKVNPLGSTYANLNWASEGSGPTFNGFLRSNANTYAGFDQTAIHPEIPGRGGRLGSDAGFTDGSDDANPDFNNDLGNFKVSARFRSSALGAGATLGFILYMNDNEVPGVGSPLNDGILAFARLATTTNIRFLVNGGASLQPAAGASIGGDSGNVAAAGGGVATDTWYTYSVEAVGDDLLMQLRRADDSLMGSYSFTIPEANYVRGVGQVGIRTGASATIITDVDDFALVSVPEPTSLAVLGLAAGAMMRRRRNS